MNGVKLVGAVVHVLNHKLAPIFEGVKADSLNRLQEKEITGFEMREAVRAMLRSIMPSETADWFSAPYMAMLPDEAGPDEACKVLHLIFQLPSHGEGRGEKEKKESVEQEGERVEQEGEIAPGQDFRSLLRSDPDTQRFAIEIVQQFFDCLGGLPLPTHAQKKAAQEEQQRLAVVKMIALQNFGTFMTPAKNLLIAAEYLQPFPEPEQQDALERVALHLYTVLRATVDAIREQTSASGEAGDVSQILQSTIHAALRTFCAENVYRPPTDG